MSDVTIAPRGQRAKASPVISGDLLLPRTGNWSAHLSLVEAPPEGRVTLSWLGSDLAGWLLRGGAYEGRASALVVGGNGGLAREVPARGYDHVVPARRVAEDIVSAAGESMAAATPLASTLSAWARLRGAAGDALDELARAIGVAWRVQLDGTIWLGDDPWLPIPDPLVAILDEDPGTSAMCAPGSVAAVPGRTIGGRKIGAVHYTIEPHQSRARIWYQTDNEPADPLKQGLYQIAREALRGVDYHAMYPAKVIVQRGDGTLDVQPESSKVPPMTSVRPRVPCHGAKVTIPVGSKVLIGFDGGDGGLPYAALWDQGVGGRAVARVGDPSKIGAPLAAWMSAVETAINTLAPGAIATLSSTFLAAPGIEVAAGSPHLSLLPGGTP